MMQLCPYYVICQMLHDVTIKGFQLWRKLFYCLVLWSFRDNWGFLDSPVLLRDFSLQAIPVFAKWSQTEIFLYYLKSMQLDSVCGKREGLHNNLLNQLITTRSAPKLRHWRSRGATETSVGKCEIIRPSCVSALEVGALIARAMYVVASHRP